MKKLIAILVLVSISNFSFSQTESENSRYTSDQLEKHFNAMQFDSIFAMFSANTQIALPFDKTKGFLTQLNNKFGKINKLTFLNNQDGFSVYKTELEKGTITLSIAVDANRAITGLYAKPYEDDTTPKSEHNVTKMHLPFKGEWSVFWGGDTKEQNYHVNAKFQKNAFDIVINNEQGKSYRTIGKTNEDYYAFGQEILAPCDAEVVLAVDGIKDNVPGRLNAMYIPGNSIVLKTKNNEFILLAHFKQASVKVKQGDSVKQGQLLGLCGNSGNSSEPHLHFHIQNIEDMSRATGVKCYFEKIEVNCSTKTNYSPVKGDRISERN